MFSAFREANFVEDFKQPEIGGFDGFQNRNPPTTVTPRLPIAKTRPNGVRVRSDRTSTGLRTPAPALQGAC
jgi:hypothetical protein